MQTLWHHYFTEAVAVLFVVDAAAAASLADASTALLSLLQHPDLQVCSGLTELRFSCP